MSTRAADVRERWRFEKHARAVRDVVDDVGVLGELAPEPCGVGQGAKGAAE